MPTTKGQTLVHVHDAALPRALDAVTVVIPAYRPTESLTGFIGDLHAAGLRHVVVVDDGSGADYTQLFAAVEQQPGTTLLRHDVNRGKGAALRTAMAHVLDAPGSTRGIVTADADGQHRAEDVRRVAQELLDRSGDADDDRLCVLGARDFDLPAIPLRSRLGNKITSAVVRVLHGTDLPDTQTGLRGISRDLLPELVEVPGDGFEHEMRALMHLLTTDAEVVHLPIETVYEGGRNLTSNFRAVRDSVAIYAAILRQFATFLLTSVLGFLVDILVFVLVIDLLFDGRPTLRAVGVATVVARAVAILVNYVANRRLVFRNGARVSRSFTRYAILAVVLVTSSWLLTTALANLLGERVVWAKLVVDACLFVASYLVQRRWVFTKADED